MKKKPVIEKNISVFNQDVEKKGQYLYTAPKIYSAYIANKRQSQEIHALLKSQSKKSLTVLDAGCGDGTYTFEILHEISVKKIVGFDSAKSAVKHAEKKIKPKDKKKIEFTDCNIYDIGKKFKPNSFDVIVVRGVLHHLYDPQKAVKAMSTVAKKIIVLEPNGYNPILKLIEKISPYHRKHEERSYWPPEMNKWFAENGYEVKKQLFCGIVPYFCPEIVAKCLKAVEPFFEGIPVIRKFYCGTNVVYYEKK